MNAYNFTWDERKDLTNQSKHGVSFDEAKSVFFDEYARLITDPEHSEDEERFILLGISSQFKTLVVCHCYRADDSEIRLISARRANKHEQKQYNRFRYA